MVDLSPEPPNAVQVASLQAQLNAEYFNIVKVVSDFDARFMIIKGWSVTIALGAIGLGLQSGHFGFFGLCSVLAATFWVTEIAAKRDQIRYYPRMRAIEVAAFGLSHLQLPTGLVSSPQIDWAWNESKSGNDPGVPLPVAGKYLRDTLMRVPVMFSVLMPHAVAFVVGLALLLLAALRLAWFSAMAF